MLIKSKNKALQLRPVRGLQKSVKDDLIARFLKNVQSSPDKIAIVTTEAALTYKELYDEVLHWQAILGQHLHDKAVVCLKRTPRLVAVLLALQSMGITYIPIDLSLPIERIQAILADSQASAFIYDRDDIDYSNLNCVKLNLEKLSLPINSNLRKPRKDSLAYIIYTSGSTGKPKGVAISRLALNNCLAGLSSYFLNEDKGLFLAITTIAFDIAALELFLPIWQQKTIFLSNQEQYKDLQSLLAILNEYPITHLQATPAMWKLLATENWQDKSKLIALCGGEALTPTLAKSLLAEVGQLWNMYGPTEATIWCSLKQIHPDEPITVGRPLDNTEMVVLDSSFKILPPYVKGELYISGLCLAEGYVNSSELTKERFIAHKSALGSRLFKVGDLACSTRDGEFIIFGRKDNQIKLHGYRIELEEIEAHLQTLTGVRESAVKLYNDQLVAYLCLSSKAEFSEEELHKRLAASLPEYMIPKRIIYLDKLPLSVSGKVARDALPPPSLANLGKAEEVVLTPMQMSLISIWTEALDISNLTIHDNFHELGGDSLTAARIALKISKNFKKKIAASDLYRAPTIELLAELISKAPDHELFDKSNTAIQSKNSWFPLDDFQLTLWVSRFHMSKLKTINNIARQRIKGNLNKKALDLALELVVQKQESLSYSMSRFYPAQKRTSSHLRWIETSLVDYETDACETYLANSYESLFYQKLWGKHAPMAIAKLFYLKNDEIELQISLSHFISDEDSALIFFQELENAYHFYTDYIALKTRETSNPFRSYLSWQHELSAKYAQVDTEFWSKYLQDADFCYFPKQYIVRNIKDKYASFSSYLEIPESLLAQMRKFCFKSQLSLNDLICAAIGLTVKSYCKDQSLPAKLFMNSIRSTREDSDYDNVIGCFLRLQSFKVDLDKDKDLLSLSKQIHQTELELNEYQRASSLVKISSVGKKSLFQASFINVFSSLFAKLSKFFDFNLILIKAYLSLAIARPKDGFMINVNILSNFFNEKANPKQTLFNLPKQPIPLHPYPISYVNNVFEVCFHRTNNRPFVAITSNLTTEFREDFGKTLLRVLEEVSPL